MAKLQAALAAINRNADQAAANQLRAFMLELDALKGKNMTPEDATSLAAAALQIIQGLKAN